MIKKYIKDFGGKDNRDVLELLNKLKESGYTNYGSINIISLNPVKFELATGGRSENEEIIKLLQKNRYFWSRYWESSHLGGLYIFKDVYHTEGEQ